MAVVLVSLLISGGGLAFIVLAFVRHGKEHPSDFPGRYLREDPMPSLHPAVVGAVWRLGEIEDWDVAATLMELANTGMITMHRVSVDASGLPADLGRVGTSYLLQRVPGRMVERPLDLQLTRFLFEEVGDGASVSLARLDSYARVHGTRYLAAMYDWKAAAAREASRLGLDETGAVPWQTLVGYAAFVIAICGVGATAIVRSPGPAAVALPVAILGCYLMFRMRRRSMTGSALYVRYRALRDFLRDFSRLDEAPPESVAIWNRFLVLAVVFGMADEVMSQLRGLVPQVVDDPGFETTRSWTTGPGPGAAPAHSVRSWFVSAAEVATASQPGTKNTGG
jgi:hypothetical protein